MNKKKLFLVLLTMFVATAGAYAQGNGMAGINAATKMVTSYFDPAQNSFMPSVLSLV